MPGVFKEIGLTWKGREYVIPPTRLLAVICEVEAVCTISDLHMMQDTHNCGNCGQPMFGKLKLGMLSSAYGVMLRAAGAPVSNDEIFGELRATEDGKLSGAIGGYIAALLLLMVPPLEIAERIDGGKPGKEGAAADVAGPSPKPSS